MSDAGQLFRVVLAIGFIVLFVNLLADDANVVADNPGLEPIDTFDDMRQTLSGGLQLPTFENPFAEDAIAYTRLTVSNDTPESTPQAIRVGCDDGWDCIRTNDRNVSYLQYYHNTSTSEFAHFVDVTMDDFPVRAVQINSVQVAMWCRSVGNTSIIFPAGLTVRFDDFAEPITPVDGVPCPQGNTFQRVAFNSPTAPDGTLWTWADIQAGLEVTIYLNTLFNGAEIHLSYFDVTVYASSQVPCGVEAEWWDVAAQTENLACQLGRFVDTIIRIVQFVFNAIVFIVSGIVSIASFMFSFVAAIVVGTLDTFVFLLAIPGAPFIVQAGIAVLIISLFVGVMVIIVNMISKVVPFAG